MDREQLLKGIVRLNNERINSESPETRSSGQVQGDGSGGADQSPDEHRAHAASEARPVPRPQESVWEYATRRKAEISRTVEEILDRDERLKVEREGLREELVKLREELDLLKPLIIIKEEANAEDSSGSVVQPAPVSGDTGNTGAGGSGEVRGKRRGRSRGVARRGPPK